MRPVRIAVSTEHSRYAVFVGAGAVARVPAWLREARLDESVTVVTCAPVWRRQGGRLPLGRREQPPILIPDGERAKTLETTARLYDAFVKRRLDRSATIVAFGGGVVGDVAGFAAASYLRGVRLVQIPTTLLAQVDSAIGGKVGVNLASGKNLVGAFHSPSLVVCDPRLLDSLPRREFRAGLYEVIKYGIIASRRLFDGVSADLDAIVHRDDRVLTALIADCCRLKARVVTADEHEHGLRRTLNFGHTVGHALESISRYRRFRHGEAVAYGMLAAAHLSRARGCLPAEDHARIADLISRLGSLPLVADLRVADALDVVSRDKKVVAGRLHFILASSIGTTTEATDVSKRELAHAMRAIGMRA